MDALKALAGQQGCSVDGTAASRNPLAQFAGQAMGGPGAMRGGPLQQQGGPQQQGPVSDLDGGFSAGMQGLAGPRGPMMGGPMAQQQHMAAAVDQSPYFGRLHNPAALTSFENPEALI